MPSRRGGSHPAYLPALAVASIDAHDPDPMRTLRDRLASRPGVGDAWCAWVSYDLAPHLEPDRLAKRARGAAPLAELVRIDTCAGRPLPESGDRPPPPAPDFESGRAAYVRAVERTLEYIRAGDIYQANIAHRLATPWSGDPWALYAGLCAAARPAHGLGILTTGPEARAVLSLSPELFLRFDARSRRLETRPMKGTRPGTADPDELLHAAKDKAELAMIVDLMRNDLGRVCEFGSVRVDVPRRVERHASGPGEVLQATATISGTVRPGLGAAEILEATFPPGSVTGTPKVRAMQIIDELEPFARGPYCGCIGRFDDDGSFTLAVAIRTVVIDGPYDGASGRFEGAELSYCVGAGIVADSDSEEEWRETITKAGVLSPLSPPGRRASGR